jgi:hypothetical protein
MRDEANNEEESKCYHSAALHKLLSKQLALFAREISVKQKQPKAFKNAV